MTDAVGADDATDFENRISMFWYKGALTAYERLCISSFINHGYDVSIYSYDEDLTLPPGVSWRNAADIIPESEVFFYRHGLGKGSIAGFANRFRYVLLDQIGGWWVDTDVICLKRLPFNPGLATVGLERADGVNNAVINAPAGHELCARAARRAVELGTDLQWGRSGPMLLTQLCLGSAPVDGVKIEPARTFYPIPFNRVVEMLLLPRNRDAAAAACRDAHGLHLYNEIFRQKGISKTQSPPPGSFLREMFETVMSDDIDLPDMSVFDLQKSIAYYYIKRVRQKIVNKFLKN